MELKEKMKTSQIKGVSRYQESWDNSERFKSIRGDLFQGKPHRLRRGFKRLSRVKQASDRGRSLVVVREDAGGRATAAGEGNARDEHVCGGKVTHCSTPPRFFTRAPHLSQGPGCARGKTSGALSGPARRQCPLSSAFFDPTPSKGKIDRPN